MPLSNIEKPFLVCVPGFGLRHLNVKTVNVKNEK